jgi:hypothetical protein
MFKPILVSRGVLYFARISRFLGLPELPYNALPVKLRCRAIVRKITELKG